MTSFDDEVIRPFLVKKLRRSLQVDADMLSRKQAVRLIAEIKRCADFLQEKLPLPVVQEAGLCTFAESQKITPLLETLGGRASLLVELASSDAASRNISRIPGFTPFQLCALYGLIVWQRRTGKWGGQETPAVQQWCEALWREAGGAHTKSTNDAEAWRSWRRHLIVAKKLGEADATKKQVRDLSGLIAAMIRAKTRSSVCDQPPFVRTP